MKQLPQLNRKKKKRVSQQTSLRQIRLNRTREEWLRLTKRAREVAERTSRVYYSEV